MRLRGFQGRECDDLVEEARFWNDYATDPNNPWRHYGDDDGPGLLEELDREHLEYLKLLLLANHWVRTGAPFRLI